MSGEGQPSPDFGAELKNPEVTEDRIARIIYNDDRIIRRKAIGLGVRKSDIDDVMNFIALKATEVFRGGEGAIDWSEFMHKINYRASFYNYRIVDYLRNQKIPRNELISTQFVDEQARLDPNFSRIEDKYDLGKIAELLETSAVGERKKNLFLHILESSLEGRTIPQIQKSLQEKMGVSISGVRISQIFSECASQIRKIFPGFPENLGSVIVMLAASDEKRNERAEKENLEAKKDQHIIPQILKKRQEIENNLSSTGISEKEKNILKRKLMIIDYCILRNDAKKVTENDPALQSSSISKLSKEISFEIFNDEYFIMRNKNIIRKAYALRTQGQENDPK